MMRVTSYEVVYGNSEQQFVKQINDMIAQGWQPIGGVSTSYIEKTQQVISHQAMVQYEQELKTRDMLRILQGINSSGAANTDTNNNLL